MDTLDRFLVKEFFGYFVPVLLAIAFLFLGIDFLANLWRTDLTITKVIEVYCYKIPEALQTFAPMACLMATLLVLSGMSKQNEILALYSSGVSTLRLVSTFIAVVAVISTLSFLVFDSLVPTFTKKQILIKKGLNPDEEHALFGLKSGLWYRSNNLIYNVGSFVPETNSLEDISIFFINPAFELFRIIHARRAEYENNQWTLREGTSILFDPESRFPNATNFDSMSGIIPEKPSDFKTLEIDEGTMRLKALRKYIDRNIDFGLDTTTQQVNYHERIAFVFAPLIFIILSFPFAIKPLKSHSAAKSVAFCFLVIFLYLLLSRLSLSAGRGGHIPPVVAAWTPNTLFLIFSAFLMARK